MPVPVLPDAVVKSVSKTLGDAVYGSDITDILHVLNVVDTSGESTKWKRIYRTFTERQHADKCANHFGAFIEQVAAPARWSGRREAYAPFRDELNETLLLAGLLVNESGKLEQVRAAGTLDESAERANRLRALLQKRAVHAAVLRFSERLLIRDGNYFHAVFEATKSVFDRIRTMTGLTEDGNKLIDMTLENGKRPFPLVALNRLDSEALRNDQRGVAHLAKGLVFAFRNVTAHVPAATWTVSEADALDMMSLCSLIHRRLDTATVTTEFQPQTTSRDS